MDEQTGMKTEVIDLCASVVTLFLFPVHKREMYLQKVLYSQFQTL